MVRVGREARRVEIREWGKMKGREVRWGKVWVEKGKEAKLGRGEEGGGRGGGKMR